MLTQLYKVPDHLPDKELQSHDLKIPHSFSPAPRFAINSSEHVACGFVYLQRPRSFTPGIHVHLASSARSRNFHLAWDVQVVLANQKRRFTWSPTDCLSGGSERNKVGVRDYKRGIFVQSGVEWQHSHIPHIMVVDLMRDAWHGASLSCGIFFLWCQFVKIGFRMKVHWFMTTILLLCVTYNLHKF